MKSRIDERLWQTVQNPAASDAQRTRAFEELRRREDLISIMRWIIGSSVVATMSLLIAQFFLQSHNSAATCSRSFGRTFVAELWAIGIWACAVVIGFLFGVPRSRTTDQSAAAPAAQGSNTARAADGAPRSDGGLSVNTNLEQISDWLTKILVGVGLTQLVKLPAALSSAAVFMSGGDCSIACPPLAAAVLLVFSPLGFMMGYLATRLYLSPAFVRADRVLSDGGGGLIDLPIGPNPDGAGGSVTSSGMNVVPLKSPSLRSMRLDSARFSAPELSSLYANAKKELAAKAYGQAVLLYEDLLKRDPANPTYLREYLWASFKRGPHWSEEIASALSRLEAVRDAGDPDFRPYVYASLTFHHLYNEASAGYDKTIALATEYRDKQKGRPAAGILINLACAYGQKHKKAAAADKKPLRDAALGAIEGAIKVDPASKSRVANLLNGIDGDDDLIDFRNEDDFKKAAGLV